MIEFETLIGSVTVRPDLVKILFSKAYFLTSQKAQLSKMMDLTSKRLLIDPSELTLSEYIDHIKLELYGRGETLITVGAGAEGDNGDGTFYSGFCDF